MTRSLRLLSIVVLLVALLPLASCKRSEPPQVKTLPSGREINIVKMKLGHLENGGRGLFIVYESELPFDDKSAVSEELREVWAAMKNAATREPDLRYVSITAESQPRGFILSSQESVEIVLHKQPDGSWGARKP